MYPYTQAPVAAHPVSAAAMPPPSSAAHAAIAQIQAVQAAQAAQVAGLQGGLQPPGLTHIPGVAGRPNPYSAYQPILYWYPSPPVSPQSAYYVHACPTTVVMKGLPFNTSLPDLLAFFEGIYEVRN